MTDAAPSPGPQPAPVPAAATPEPAQPQSPPEGAHADGAPTPPAAPEEAAQAQEPTSIGSGGDAAAATSRPGHGTVRAAALRHADRFIVEGDNVGQKNVYLLGGRRTGRLRAVPPLLVAAAREAFVDPKSWDEVRSAASNLRTVILHGKPGHGKMTAAIRLLLPACGKLYVLDDAADPDRLVESLDLVESSAAADRGSDGGRGPGFILNRPVGLALLRGSVLHALEDALLCADARLVITASTDGVAPGADLLHYLVELPDPPEFREVVASHLRWNTGSDAAADRLLADEAMEELIRRQKDHHPTCEQAAWLAAGIAAEAESGEKIDVGRITDRITRRDTQDFEVWFAGLRDAETHCFAIALAVLAGAEYERIARAARRLYERLGKPRDWAPASPDAQPEFSGPFRRTRVQLLQRLRACAEPLAVAGPHGGKCTAEALSYVDPEYPRKVIEHVWTGYQIHDVLIDWLSELADDPAEQVRVSAGTALGLLATKSFNFLSGNVLIPWAAGEHSGRRDAVAYALRVVASDPALIDNVRRLTAAWYANKERPLMQATAARVHGVGLGPLDPPTAVRALERLFGTDDVRVAVAVGDSLADLLESGEGDIAAQVLTALRDALPDADRAAAVQLCFLILADTLTVDVPRPGTRTDRLPADGAAEDDPARHTSASWPALLDLAARDERIREPLTVLWGETLNASRFHKEAEAVLAFWAGLAEADERLRIDLVRLLRSVGRLQRRSMAIVERCARTWAADDSLAPLPLTSAAVLTLVAHETERTS